MKTRYTLYLLVALLCARGAIAQPTSAKRAAAAGDYATDITTVQESQKDALDQAKQMLEEADDATKRDALQTAIKQMQAAEKSLESAKKNPADLPAAVNAEQAAYQALLKLVPHEYQVKRAQRSKQRGSGSGQPGQQQMEQLDMPDQENRYETERQAAAPPTGAQKEQLEAADRLKQLAQRQQDLNDRLRELQTALQAARTEKEQEEIKRELKHLADEEKQMLNDVDELQQKLNQSSNASSLSQTSKDLDQTRQETQRAAEELANQSVSQALASGTRAQQSMQNVRENLRSQTSSQFSNQMRQLQSQARDLAKKEEEIGHSMENMDSAANKTLDNEKERQQLTQQLAQQETALNSLMTNMQEVTEKAETTEPLLSEQLYDTLRRAGQMHTENLLETSGQLVDRGFLSKAAEVELSARTNINELRQRVEHAAESVLGSQADALRFAQSELDQLSKQVERGLGGADTNAAASASGRGTNSLAMSEERTNSTGRAAGGTNSASAREQASRSGQQGSRAGQQRDQNGEQATREGQQNGQNGQQAGRSGQAKDQNGEQAARDGQQGEQAGRDGQQGGQNGEQASRDGQQGQNGQQGNRDGQQANGGGTDRLRELVQQRRAGNNGGGGAVAGPLLGDDFANWADRMRDVEQVIDSVDLRNRLAAIRERVGGYRADYRYRGRLVPVDSVKVQVVQPLLDIRAEIQEDIARLENARSLVPLDHDPVPDNYAELVRKYYEKLGGGQ